MSSCRFALIGAAGYIAPRHMQAIHATGNHLIAAVDPHDCVGRLDQYFPDARFFTEIERFDRHVEKLRRCGSDQQIQYISVCSPNYLHDAHMRLALRVGANAICEKPLVISPWNLDAIAELEADSGNRVFNVLQLRLVPSLQKLKQELDASVATEKADICLTYITRRGRWYDVSWKGNQEKSGGIALNIGIHFFDLLLWLFGEAESSTVNLKSKRKMAGTLEMERARVRWFLSADEDDLPPHVRQSGGYAYRSMTYDGQEIEFTGFSDLHTRVYEEILAGRGFGLQDARPAIELVHRINLADVSLKARDVHPLVSGATNNCFIQPSVSKAA